MQHPDSWRYENLKKRQVVEFRQVGGALEKRAGKLGQDPSPWKEMPPETKLESETALLKKQGFAPDGPAMLTLSEKIVAGNKRRNARPTEAQLQAALSRSASHLNSAPQIASQYSAMWRASLDSHDPPHASSSFGEIELTAPLPQPGEEYAHVHWLAVEADGGCVGAIVREGQVGVVYLDNEGQLRLTGDDLLAHFAWRSNFYTAFEGDFDELAAFARAYHLPSPPSTRSEWEARMRGLEQLAPLAEV
ncbi:MAG: hypothetical protein IPK60_07570 [Sandaracinaceae bacterium]|nr:hypothetical protein [Sandaracinaceae bacterium]